MLTSTNLRDLVHTLSLLIDKAVKDGYERTMLTSAILFGFISQRMIARNIGCSHQTVGRIALKLLNMALPLPDFHEMDGHTLLLVFYPTYKKRISYKRRPPIELLEKEKSLNPRKFALKIRVIYLAYRKVDPSTALSYSQFCAIWAAYCKQSKLELRFLYEPGEVLFCDFGGLTVKYRDRKTGKNVQLNVFVAVLGFSKYMFAYLTSDLTAKSWITALVKAIHFFGRSPAVIQFDNAALVAKSGLLPELNERAKIFSRYYGVICDTSRVGTPRDNANAEKHVQHIQNHIIAPMQREIFSSKEEAQAFVDVKLKELNDTPMQKTKRSRTQDFIEVEWPALNEIIEVPLEPFDDRFIQKSSAYYTVEYLQHEYSVPYRNRNTYLTLEVKENQLTVFDDLEIIATHTLSNEKHGRTVLDEHRPPHHSAEAKKNEIEFTEWAKSVGASTVAIVAQQYENMKSSHSRPAGKRCIALQGLCKQFGSERLERACAYALTQNMRTVDDIRLIIKSGIFEDDDEPEPLPPLPTHQNVRGKAYFEGYRHE